MGKPKKNAKIAFRNKGEELAAAEAARKNSYVIVRQDDARIAKYPHVAGGEGFSLENAQQLAIPAHPEQPTYRLITVEQYEFIAAHPEPIGSQQAVNLFARQAPAEETQES